MENITFKIEGTKTLFSCGCVSEVIGDNYVLKACKPDCVVTNYVLEESERQGNKVSIRREKDNR